MKSRVGIRNRPIVIGIGGSRSNIGKTTVATAILNRLKGWGAIKYTKTAIYSSIIDDVRTLLVKGKDTGRFFESGASVVLWVQSPRSGLSELMPVALDRVSDLEGIILEGNSAIESVNPDIIVFVTERDISRIKESGKRILDRADVVYYRDKGEIEIRDGQNMKGGVEEIASTVYDMIESQKKIKAVLIEGAENGRIPCSVARRIAEHMKVPYKKVGEIADKMGIKITNCELGCF